MIENVLDGCGFVSFNKHAHARDADDTARVSDFLDRFVSFETRMARHDRATV
jgi:hypothetical protein